MPDLLVTRALPNPAGKDRSGGHAPNEQLNGEWVQFLNTTQGNLSLDGLALDHVTFNQYCQQTGAETLVTFTGSLGPGRSIRVHTGVGNGYWEGDVYHFFAGHRNYVWNNRCGDVVMLRVARSVIDSPAYGGNPPEGRILERVRGENRLA